MNVIRGVAIVLLTLPQQTLQPSTYSSCVVDEAATNRAVVDLRVRLLSAIKSRSASALQPLVDAEVRYDFTEQGLEGFSRAYRLTDPSSPMWRELESDLLHGGKFIGDDFCAPYYMCPTWPGDGGEIVFAVLRAGVPILDRSVSTAESLGVTKCEVIRVPAEANWPDAASGWMPVWLPPGRWGFVEAQYLAAAQTAIRLSNRDGRWLLVAVLGID